MPISLSKLLNSDVMTLKVNVGLTEPLHVTYYPSRVTAEIAMRLTELGEQNDIREICGELVTLIDRWDLEDDEGQPLSVSQVLLMKLPIRALMAIVEAMTTDLNPQTARVRPSGGGSSLAP